MYLNEFHNKTEWNWIESQAVSIQNNNSRIAEHRSTDVSIQWMLCLNTIPIHTCQRRAPQKIYQFQSVGCLNKMSVSPAFYSNYENSKIEERAINISQRKLIVRESLEQIESHEHAEIISIGRWYFPRLMWWGFRQHTYSSLHLHSRSIDLCSIIQMEVVTVLKCLIQYSGRFWTMFIKTDRAAS